MKNVLKKYRISNYWLIALGFIAIKFLLHILTSHTYELHRDELLYFDRRKK